jgi:DNA invertase Pin-like site-specific DNA recombinase
MPTTEQILKKPVTGREYGVRRYVAVIRVSQRKGRKGSAFMSPEDQRKAIYDYCERNGIVILKLYDETDSVSGRTTNRVGLQAAMADCLDGRADGLIVAKVDRFARNVIEGLTAVKKLNDAGKAFVAVANGIVTDGEMDPQAKMFLGFLMMMAEWQLDSLTDGWLTTRENFVRNGVAQTAPYGYRKDETTRKLVIHEPEARWVRLIFAERAKRTPWHTICELLDDAGAPTASGAPKWVHSTLCRYVTNRRYLGEQRSGDDIVNPDAHPAIITPEMWDAAHGSAGTPKRADRDPFLLAGIVRCGSCGGRMTGSRDVREEGTYTTYRCRRRFSWGMCPAPARCDADTLDTLATGWFEDNIGDLEAEGLLGLDPDDQGAIDARKALDDAEADLEAWASAPGTMRLARSQPAAYEKTMAGFIDAVQALRDHLASFTQGGLGLGPDIGERWETASSEDRREMLSLAFACIAVWPGDPKAVEGRVGYWWRDETDSLPDLPVKGRVGNAITPIPCDE